MAYIDLSMRPPEADTATTGGVPTGDLPPQPAAPAAKSRAALWMSLAVAGLIAALVFALAIAAIGEPWTAAVVTIVMLLPGASLFGGNSARRV